MKRASLLTVLVLGCGDDPWNRMYEQPKARAQHQTSLFPDGRVNRVPPLGTVARERPLELERAAPAMTLALLEKGRRRYDIVCATCHGLTGEADTVVAGNFAQRHPPSFHEPRLREKDDAWLFNAVTLGYGVMPSFPDLPVEERWAIVGYVRALQLSQRATLDQAPPEEQARLKATKTGPLSPRRGERQGEGNRPKRRQAPSPRPSPLPGEREVAP